jgi:hypothetical protein
MWRSLAATAALTVTLTLPALVVAQEAPATQKSLPEQLVDAFNGVFGVHPGMRANHPKGVALEGTFTPAASAGLGEQSRSPAKEEDSGSGHSAVLRRIRAAERSGHQPDAARYGR